MTNVTHGSLVSADGTEIGYSRFGEGPSVVVCHGAFTVANDWAGLAQELATSNTVYLYDRRGRGRSAAEGKTYSFTAEIDDLAAVVALAGPNPAILGHSFGGACALAYALRDGFAGRLMLYEPMNSIPRQLSGGHLPELIFLVKENNHEVALEFALEKIIRMSRSEIGMLRQTPMWKPMVTLVPSFVREIEGLDRFAPTVEEAATLRAQTWLLVGTQSVRDPNRTCSSALIDRIPNLILYPIHNQGHLAYLFDPPLLSRLVARCLTDDPTLSKVASREPDAHASQ